MTNREFYNITMSAEEMSARYCHGCARTDTGCPLRDYCRRDHSGADCIAITERWLKSTHYERNVEEYVGTMPMVKMAEIVSAAAIILGCEEICPLFECCHTSTGCEERLADYFSSDTEGGGDDE